MPEGLLQLYQQYEAQHRITEDTFHGPMLVTSNGNSDRPVHRWVKFKEGFSSELLPYVLAMIGWSPRSLSLLDPFCGVGTSLLSALALWRDGWTISATGIEVNPFLQFVARTKCNCRSFSPQQMLIDGRAILARKTVVSRSQIPVLSTIRRPDVFAPEVLDRLLQLRSNIEMMSSEATRDPLLLGFAEALAKVAGVRKDGRALRLIERAENVPVEEVIEAQWEQIAQDILWAQEHLRGAPKVSALLGDGRSLEVLGNCERQYDLILYSPPYLNNIDYTEVYKIELWMLGFITTYDEFRAQRRRTMRSHPSCRFPDEYRYLSDVRLRPFMDELGMVFAAIPDDRDRKWRLRLILGYFDDICQALTNQKRCLKEDGRIVIVVGNSLHGGKSGTFLLATDLLIARVASLLGLKVNEIRIARYLTRRNHYSPYLRETIMVLSR